MAVDIFPKGLTRMAETNITKSVDQERQLVAFRLQNEEFGVEITRVREIIKPTVITKLPHVSDFIEGVTNLRGEVIPVISLRKRFGVSHTNDTQTTRIIIIDAGGSRVGFVVDEVTEVLRLPSSAIEPPPRSISGLSAEFLQGVGKINDRLLILLDVDRLLTDDEQVRLSDLETETDARNIEE